MAGTLEPAAFVGSFGPKTEGSGVDLRHSLIAPSNKDAFGFPHLR